ncbi:hypothetical protein DC007_14630, partial [Enterococcus faecalis]
NAKPLQILFLDIASAFDSISPTSIKQVMDAMDFPPIFTAAVHNLTHNGTGVVSFQGEESDEFSIDNGSGQGDPASAPRFVIGLDPGLRALKAVMVKYSYKHSDGTKAELAGFADDLQGCM